MMIDFGDDVKTCGHSTGMGNIQLLVIPAEAEDWAWALEHFEIKTATAIRLCWDCAELRPSIQKERKKIETQKARRKEEDRQEHLDVIRRVKAGEVVHICPKCEEEVEPAEVRHCPHCDSNFNGDDCGRNCPDCNRPFSSLVTEQGCPDCLEEDDVEPYALTAEDEKLLAEKGVT